MKTGSQTGMFLIAILLAGTARGTDYYVASSGSGSPGTNWLTAFTDIQTALSTATSGEKIYIKGGTYSIASALSWTRSGLTILGGYEGVGTPGSRSISAGTAGLSGHTTRVDGQTNTGAL